MEQLDLFITEVLPSNPTFKLTASIEAIAASLKFTKPTEPGWYYAGTKILYKDITINKIQDEVLFWSGHSWVGVEGIPLKVLYSSVYHVSLSNVRPEKPELKPELLPREHIIGSSDKDWRTDKPPFPGAYFATNARSPNFSYIKTWDGRTWSNNKMDAQITDGAKRMIWFSGKYPTDLEIGNQIRRY